VTQARARHRRSLMGQTFSNQKIAGDFRNGLAYKSLFTNILFNAIMGKIQLQGSAFKDCNFDSCNMSMAVMSACEFENCLFTNCDLDQAVFDSSIIKNTRFINGRAQYASFYNTTLNNVLLDTDLHGADLRWAEAKNVNLGESNLWGASINFSCSFFKDKTFSERQFKLFLALTGETLGNDDLRQSAKSLAGEFVCKMMAMLADREA